MHSGSKSGLGYLSIQLSKSPESFKKIGGGKLITHYRPAMLFGNRKKNVLKDLFSSVLSKL